MTTVGSQTEVGEPTLSDRPAATVGWGWTRSGVVAFALLTTLYFVLSLFGSPHAYLSTDVGGKTGALAAMIERGDWSTDLGYWAEGSDPQGLAYPFAHTAHTESGWWVNTTSLPMVLAARPLWAIGGPQLALLIPMAAAAGAAVVAGRIQERLSSSSGRSAMWVVGLSTPIAVYALDFWEHSIGVFLMGLGALLVLDAVEASSDGSASNHRAFTRALGSGMAFGFAATMRQEALVYGFAAGLSLAVGVMTVRPRRRHALQPRALVPIAAMAVGAIGMLAANSLVENWFYGESLRSARGTGIASTVGSNPMVRIEAMFTTMFSPINAIHPIATFFGLVILGGLAWLLTAVVANGDVRRPAALLVAVGTILALRVIQSGPTFVPGLLPTAPLAAAGVAFGFLTLRHRLVAAMALLPLPIIYLTQYPAGAVPQWGGRYLLGTGFLLVVVACAELPSRRPMVFRGLVAGGLLVTATGVWFNAVRTSSLEADFAMIEEVAADDVVVWYDSIKAREAGPEVVEHRWLSTVGDAETDTVLSVLEAHAIDRFVYVDPIDAPAPTFDGYAARSEIGAWELSPILRQRLTIFERTN